MDLAYYPGCSLYQSAKLYNHQTKLVFGMLDLHLKEIEDWSCCGATSAGKINDFMAVALPARNLGIAESTGFAELVIPCSACYSRTLVAQKQLEDFPLLKNEINIELSRKVKGKIKVSSTLDVLKKAITDTKFALVSLQKLEGYKPACYYGCMYTRPRHIFPEKDAGPGSESTSKPHFMDDLLAAAGAENVEFPLKTACCGGAHTLSDSDTSTKLVLNILKTAKMAGADVIATECPTCHSGLEMHQIRAEKTLGEKVDIKILYFTQLLGMALGLKAKKVGVHENVSDSMTFLKEKGLG